MMIKMAAMAGVVGFLAMGCSAAVDSGATADATETESQASAMTAATGQCKSFTTAQRADGQARATLLYRYVMGDNSAFPSDMSAAAKASLTALRNGIIDGTFSVGAPVDFAVCGRQSHYVDITTTSTAGLSIVQGLDSVFNDPKCSKSTMCSAYAILNWSDPTSFSAGYTLYYNMMTRQFAEAELIMDPEPVQVTGALSGSTGASAAAVFVNTQAPTTVVKWPGTFTTGGAAPPAAGAPCSTLDLAPGTQASQGILKNGNYYKCI